MNNLDTSIWDMDLEEKEEVEYEAQASEQIYLDEEVIDNSSFFEQEEQEEQELSVMESARIRLEQGRLYEMLIKHNLFDGVDAMPKAISRVEEELKSFILERLEILLGMRSEKQNEIQQIIQQPQFNDLEVRALKMMASKVTKGASKDAPTSPPEQQIVTAPLNPVQKKPMEQKLNSLGSPKNIQKRPIPTPTPSSRVPVRKNVTPLPKPEGRRVLKKELQKDTTENSTPEELAKKDIKYLETLKGMSLEDASKVVAERHGGRPRPNVTIDQNAINGHYQTKVALNENGNTWIQALAIAKRN